MKKKGEEEWRGGNMFSLQRERSHVSEASVTLLSRYVQFLRFLATERDML